MNVCGICALAAGLPGGNTRPPVALSLETISEGVSTDKPWRRDRKAWDADMREMREWYAEVGIESESSDPMDSPLSDYEDRIASLRLHRNSAA